MKVGCVRGTVVAHDSSSACCTCCRNHREWRHWRWDLPSAEICGGGCSVAHPPSQPHCTRHDAVVPSLHHSTASEDAGHARQLALRCSRQLFALDGTSFNLRPADQDHPSPSHAASNVIVNHDDTDDQSPWVRFRAPSSPPRDQHAVSVSSCVRLE